MADGSEKAHLRAGPLVGMHEELPFPNRAWRSLNVVFDPADGFGRRPGRVSIYDLLDGGGACQILDLAWYYWRGNARQLAVTERAGLLRFWLLEEAAGTWTELAAPDTADLSWSRGQFVWSLQRQGFLLFSLPSEQLIAFDGAQLITVDALPGRDFAEGVIGARQYLATTPPAGLMERWRGRLVMFKGRRGQFSADEGDTDIPPEAPLGAPNVWPASSYADLEGMEGEDEAMGLAVARDRLEIYSRLCVFLMDEDDVGPTVRKLEEAPGILAPKSLQNVGAMRIYLGHGAVYGCNGSEVAEISEPIRDTLRRVNWVAAAGAVSAHLRSKSEYWLWLPLAGSDVNSFAVIFDYRRKEWRVAAGELLSDPAAQTWDVRCAKVVTLAQGDQVLLTGSKGSPAKIFRERVGEDDDGFIFPAFALLTMMGEGGRHIAWGDVRLEANEDGAFIELRALSFGEYVEAGLARAPDCDLRAIAEDDGEVFDATYPVTVTDSRTVVLAGRVAQLAEQQRLLVSLPGGDGVSLAESAPGRVRWVEVTLKARQGRAG